MWLHYFRMHEFANVCFCYSLIVCPQSLRQKDTENYAFVHPYIHLRPHEECSLNNFLQLWCVGHQIHVISEGLHVGQVQIWAKSVKGQRTFHEKHLTLTFLQLSGRITKFILQVYNISLPFSRSGRAARINARSAATSWKRWRYIQCIFRRPISNMGKIGHRSRSKVNGNGKHCIRTNFVEL